MRIRRLRAVAALAISLVLAPGVAHAQSVPAPPAGLEQMRAFAAALVRDGLYDEAIDAYALIADTLPGDAGAQYDLAGALAFVRRYADAVAAVEKAIVLEPGDVRFHELAALSYEQLEQHERAMQATRRGAELGDIKAMYTLAAMYEHGHGIAASNAHALAWLQRAAEGGHMSAMDDMVRVFEQGLYDQSPDPARAKAWRDRLAEELAR